MKTPKNFIVWYSLTYDDGAILHGNYLCKAFNTTDARLSFVKWAFKTVTVVSVKIESCLLVDSDEAWEDILSRAHPPH